MTAECIPIIYKYVEAFEKKREVENGIGLLESTIDKI